MKYSVLLVIIAFFLNINFVKAQSNKVVYFLSSNEHTYSQFYRKNLPNKMQYTTYTSQSAKLLANGIYKLIGHDTKFNNLIYIEQMYPIHIFIKLLKVYWDPKISVFSRSASNSVSCNK